MKKISFVIILFIVVCIGFGNIDLPGQVIDDPVVFPGADERTPSRSEYFSWINNTNEGPTEGQTLINLEFFKWLQDTYGMDLDIYAFDAGTIDGSNFYGSMYSRRFKRQFPRGFDPVYNFAKSMNTRLGLWGGPDGFGDTPADAESRIEMMVQLCRDYDFTLFKMDAVCGELRVSKTDYFIEMMKKCRKYAPDLILLNHRLNLGRGLPYATTSLLGGAETYIDVHMVNRTTAPHHRARAISRKIPPNLTRLTEDHGVCLSSCLDYWQDELILQAFNRSLILAPQIYGNPWLLKDSEFPKLARIYNLHRKYRKLLVNGKILPADQYGPEAVSRGDTNTRFISLRNLTWDPVSYTVILDTSIGLNNRGKVYVRQYHPVENIFGTFPYGSPIEIEVLPFRSCLLMASITDDTELGIAGCTFEIVQDVKNKPVKINLLGMSGEIHKITLKNSRIGFNSAKIDGRDASELLKNKSKSITFSGDKLTQAYHRKIGVMQPCDTPADSMALYEATQFAANNNALEVRSLKRSGETGIIQVQKARDAFFTQNLFIEREIWDRYAFDDDEKTAFSVSMRWGDKRIKGGALRIDLGEAIDLDSLILKTYDEYSLQPWKTDEAKVANVSADLKTWQQVRFLCGTTMVIDFSDIGPLRYLEVPRSILRLSEIEGFKDGKSVPREKWRASNLFAPSWRFQPQKVWILEFSLKEIAENSYLAIALEGKHGVEGATAAMRIDGEYYGAPDRAPSYQSNTWEYPVPQRDENYTYFIPVTPDMKNKNIQVFVQALDKKNLDFKPVVWVSAYPIPYEKKELILW
jgi:hypothetical protein